MPDGPGAGPPPGTVPEFPVDVRGPDIWSYVVAGLNALMGHPKFKHWIPEVAGKVAYEVVLAMNGALVHGANVIGKGLSEFVDEIEEATEGERLKMAVTGLNDYFGTNLSPADFAPRGSTNPNQKASSVIGKVVMAAMFQSLQKGAPLTPEQGRENAERMVTFAVQTALEGWMMGLLGSGYLSKIFPNWADLDDVMSATLGLGRATRRVMAPLLNTLVVEPFTQDLNRRFAPAEFSEGQAARAHIRGDITLEQFHDIMGRLGWTRAKAAVHLALQRRLLTDDDIDEGLRARTLSEEAARKAYQELGFLSTETELKLRVIRAKRVTRVEGLIGTLLRDMFRDREIGEGEYRRALHAAGFDDAETEGLVGLGHLERARPRELSQATMERAFFEGLVDLGRLHRWYTDAGFTPGDVALLELMAVKRKLEQERPGEEEPGSKPLSRAQATTAFVRGIIGEGELRAVLEGEGFEAGAIAVLLELARQQRADRLARQSRGQEPEEPEPAPRSTLEEGFARGLISEDQLRDGLARLGYGPGDVALLVAVAEQHRAELAARVARLESSTAALDHKARN